MCQSLPDAEAKAQLNRALKDEFAGPEDDPVPADADGDTLPALADEEGLVVQHVDLGHRRCMVDMGNDPPSIVIKLYFDNSTHQSGRPRGWSAVSTHVSVTVSLTVRAKKILQQRCMHGGLALCVWRNRQSNATSIMRLPLKASPG